MSKFKKDPNEGRAGYKLIFRWTKKCPQTGRIIRGRRPMPMWVKDDQAA